MDWAKEWVNYHHLLYFYVTVREGTVTKAARQLRLTQPTVSAQLRMLERSLGCPLLEKSGRNLALTEAGRLVFRYAEDIFAIGREMVAVVKGRASERMPRLSIGVVDSIPKTLVYRLLEPVFSHEKPVKLVCREGDHADLLTTLATHGHDVVLADSPVGPTLKLGLRHHRIGSSGISFLATSSVARRLRGEFPACLKRAPVVLPCQDTSLRRELDHWLATQEIFPRIVAEVDDNALLLALGRKGVGVVLTPTITAPEVMDLHRLVMVGATEEVTQSIFMITAERRPQNPLVLALARHARSIYVEKTKS